MNEKEISWLYMKKVLSGTKKLYKHSELKIRSEYGVTATAEDNWPQDIFISEIEEHIEEYVLLAKTHEPHFGQWNG